jgi:outer membrane protein assembly factor BamB
MRRVLADLASITPSGWEIAMKLKRYRHTRAFACWVLVLFTILLVDGASPAEEAAVTPKAPRGLYAVLGLARPERPEYLVDLAVRGGHLVYFQTSDAAEAARVREAAEAAGALGRGVFVDIGDPASIHLASNLASVVIVSEAARAQVPKEEILRVLHPGGTAHVGEGALGEPTLVKPAPEGVDSWSHPYHGPDNNPQSTDQVARKPYLTQFLAEPKFVPMPEVSVAAGGRVFRAFGHIAHKANQNAMLNKLLCVNAYNGIILWQRDLPEGFMIHRNTMIATEDALYLADHLSAKRIDARTGDVAGSIVLPEGIADGPVWKWMALEGGVLYALVGGREVGITTQRSDAPGLGHWPWGMWDGHDYADPRTSFGFGRTFAAFDPKTGALLWSHKEEEYVDSRGVCMKGGRIYYYVPEKFLACLEARSQRVIWKSDARDLLDAIGPNGRAQHYVTGYATTTYIKCNDDHVFFAGPQRSRLVVVRASDGKLLWQKEHGNLQLVLRDDGFYAAGPEATGAKLDYATGNVLATLPHRRACTRATGSVDSIFYRTTGGTVRIDAATNAARHIAPMRPACQDGVIISDGHLFWGPWMCGCQLSLYGHIALGPASEYLSRARLDEPRFRAGPEGLAVSDGLEARPGDWPTYLGHNDRFARTAVPAPRAVSSSWSFEIPGGSVPTAPVVAGGMTFVGDRAGAVRALDEGGRERWKASTGGPVYFPPAVEGGRAFVGSADGRVYAFESRSGRLLWQYRVAPGQRWIPVYGALVSTWPVSGGVVVEGGVVYAAAGIAHYDGTYVVALDAASGAVRWANDTSGTLSEEVESGVSLQGSIRIAGGELQFLGGGIYQTARYDLASGRCLNEPYHRPDSRFQTAFEAYYPEYGRYLSVQHHFADGRTLQYAASYDGSQHSPLALLAPAEPAAPEAGRRPEAAGGDARPRADARARSPQRKALWSVPGRRYHSLIVAPGAVLAAGEAERGDRGDRGDRRPAFLAAFDLETGAEIWRERLPAAAVKGGIAIDSAGGITVALEDGRILRFAKGS